MIPCACGYVRTIVASSSTLIEHAFQVGVEQGVGEPVIPGVACRQFLVGFHDCNQMDVLPRAGRGDEATGVIVDQPDDGKTNGFGFGTERYRSQAEESDQEDGERFHIEVVEIAAAANGANRTGRAILRVRVITEKTLKDMNIQPLSKLQPNLLHHAGLHVAQCLA